MQRVKETSNRRAARLDVRLAQRAKEKIEEAALVSHQTLTDFVVTNLLRASDEALNHDQSIRLTNRDRDLFLAALDADERPNPACARQPKCSTADPREAVSTANRGASL